MACSKSWGKKRESEKAIISTQNEAKLAQLEHEIIGQEAVEKKQNSKVSETVTSLKHCLVPSPNANTDAESMDKFANPCTVELWNDFGICFLRTQNVRTYISAI